MKYGGLKRICAAIAFVFSGLTFAQSANADPLSIDAIAKFPAIEQVSLSPDGKHIVGLVAVEGQKWPVISVWETANLQKRPVWIPTQEMRYHFVDFLGNDKLVFVVQDAWTRGNRKDLQRKLYISDLDGGNYDEPLRKRGTGKAGEQNLSFSIFFDNFDTPE